MEQLEGKLRQCSIGMLPLNKFKSFASVTKRVSEKQVSRTFDFLSGCKSHRQALM